MLRWFRHTITLDIPIDADGTTLRKQLEFVKKQTGETPVELIPPCDLPPQALRVWMIYKDGFMPNIMGAQQTPYQEFRAYAELTGNNLEEWEVNALKQLDTTYVGILMEHNSNGTNRKSDI